ncbi:hypothetical protein GBAR_LOCUS14093, partial [Geodia barretti]
MEEAVIGCSLYPISGLLKMPYLQHALRQSIDKYVMEASTGGGPYWITFGDDIDDPKYITVDHANERMLTGTVNFKDAEGFTVKVFDDSASTNRFEFSITSSFPRYRKKKQDEQNECQDSGAHAFGTLQPLEYYLETTFNSIRKRSTVHMRKSSRLENVRLLLKERIEPKMSCHTKQWRKGREAYYI